MNVEKEIRKLMLVYDVEDFDKDQTFEDLGLNTLDVVEIIVDAESVFGAEISDEMVGLLKTPAQLMEHLSDVTGYE